MKKIIKDYVIKNFNNILYVTISISLGIILGLVLFGIINVGIKNDLINTMKKTLELTKKENFYGINILKNGITSNIILVSIIYMISLNYFSKYLILFLSVLKGISLGIYIPTLFSIFGLKSGIITFILIFLIPNLLYLPSFIYIIVNSIIFHNKLISKENKIKIIVVEIIKIIIGFSLMFLAIIIEQFSLGTIISIYNNL